MASASKTTFLSGDRSGREYLILGTWEMTGDRKAYRADPQPLGEGGYASVFRAVHVPTGRVVALKRLNTRYDDDAHRRMQREIRALQKFGAQPHVMPILDASPADGWYVMPLAEGDLHALRMKLTDAELVHTIVQVARGLSVAHEADWVHRDVKPQNLLCLGGDSPVWVVADWGLVRGPRGLTTHPLTSRADVLGTEGFIAPEVLQGAHTVTPAADVFSLARVMAWAVTGQWPLAGDLEPPTGPFRQVIRAATAVEPAQRLHLEEFVEQLQAVRLGPLPHPRDAPDELLRRAHAGESAAAVELMLTASEHSDDADLHLDVIVRLPVEHVRVLVRSESQLVYKITQAIDRHLDESFGYRDFDYLNVILGWMLNVAQAAAENGQIGLLEDVVALLFEADPKWDRWRNRQRVQRWLDDLHGPAAESVARALLASQRAVEFYGDGRWRPARSADSAIRGVF